MRCATSDRHEAIDHKHEAGPVHGLERQVMSAAFRSSRGSRILGAEIKESFFMAMQALAAHKLRSALTLLGVMVGVFSIIMVMTAMRVLQRNIESELTQLGANTFEIQKWP